MPPPLATERFDYAPPPRLVAQTPAQRRDHARLLIVDRAARTVAHRVFADLPDYLRAGDTLFRNNASVLPARLRGRRPTGGEVECLLLGAASGDASASGAELWRCLIKPGGKLPPGAKFAHLGGAFTAEIVSRETGGSAVVRFVIPGGESVTALAHRLGEVPLPPYIERTSEERRAFDRERYQTVYADPARPVAVAAPTAGLHFTDALLARLAAQGVRTADLTLHVGLGTFRPIATETVEAHPIHSESYEIPPATQRALFPESGDGRRIAVGTTTVRAIEDFLAAQNLPGEKLHAADTSIYLYPPHLFRGADALITNFHQPRSTLLCLVAAFLTPGSTDGIAWLREIYAEAIAKDYRFFSYGDAMLIV
jgi:S-adenosylmethionine:tRNA ribosyltransferase-isomerase